MSIFRDAFSTATLTKQEAYILHYLKSIKSAPVTNMVTLSPMPLNDLVPALQSLHNKKLIALKGPVDLDTVSAVLADAKSVTVPEVQADGRSWKSGLSGAFAHADDAMRMKLETTYVAMTWRGRAKLVLPMGKPTALDVAGNIVRKR